MYASKLAYESVFDAMVQSTQVQKFCEETASKILDESLDGVTTSVLFWVEKFLF